ncbi:hypothetical protein JAK44_17660 [Stenotrophomonas maltophilia]|nr:MULTISPECIES: hypothetical protein [Stenotrophomonas]MCU1002771.1 hypothetical protein [Stenotrophomonas maltophilia]
MADIDETSLQVLLKVSFENSVSTESLVAILNALESAAYQAETAELRQLRRSFPSLPEVATDAAAYRLQNEKGRVVRYSSADDGSILLIGAVAGLSYYILDKTLGQTISEAWSESESHERLKAFLKKRRFIRSREVERRIKSPLERRGIYVESEFSDGPQGEQLKLFVHVPDESGANNSFETKPLRGSD